MGYSGRPSLACEPCRKKRTKCNMALPACKQCVNKGRICTGYRNEQDLLFKVFKPPDMQRHLKPGRRPAMDAAATPTDEAPTFFPIDPRLLSIQQPSRTAAIEIEARNHFFAHYNEKFFAPESQQSGDGFDYILPVYQADLATGGPLPDIVTAAGLAALGNANNSPNLMIEAKRRQTKAVSKLSLQIQNQTSQKSDSAILTCIMLGVFENIKCDLESAAKTMAQHLRGAAEMARLRGRRQFNNTIGMAIYSRMRGFMLAHCLQTRDPVPAFILEHLENRELSKRDFEPGFYRLLARLCQLRAQHKEQGYLDAQLANEAQSLVVEFEAWAPGIPHWRRDRRPTPASNSPDASGYRYIWLATIWIFQLTARVLASDLVIEWARAQVTHEPGSLSSAALADAIQAQIELCEEVKDSTSFYLRSFRDTQLKMRMVGGYGLLWPLYVLSTASTSTAETMQWIATHSELIAETFGVRQGKMMADFMKMYL